MNRCLPFASTVAALASLVVLVPARPARAQDIPTGYNCTFKRGASQAYAKGRYRAQPAKPLTMEIGAIDLEGQRAELISPEGGKGALRIVRALGANHFLEVVAEGYLNITTVYQRDEVRGHYPAVHSRHFGLFGEPLVAQYAGTCKGK